MGRGVFVIAEAGVNHNGSVQLARQLVDAAAECGADAVKFQTFQSAAVISRFAQKAEYQVTNTGSSESQLEMVRKLELSESEHQVLVDRCRQRGIQFLSTPFDLGSVRFLSSVIGLRTLKIPSGEITNLPLLLAVGRAAQSIIMSTGMSTLAEVGTALAALEFAAQNPSGGAPALADLQRRERWPKFAASLGSRVVLLHCTTEYPAPFGEVNLRAMDTLAATFGLPVGYSDHTPGESVAVAAVARGAVVIEKHMTLDRALPGPDHIASLEPGEFATLVRMIREVEGALGSSDKQPAPSEIKNMAVARKSLVATRDIKRGESFTELNLTTKRPGSGISALHFYEFLGRPAARDFLTDELIDEL